MVGNCTHWHLTGVAKIATCTLTTRKKKNPDFRASSQDAPLTNEVKVTVKEV